MRAPDITSPLYDGLRHAVKVMCRGCRAWDEARTVVVETLNQEEPNTIAHADIVFRVYWTGDHFKWGSVYVDGQIQYFDLNGNLLEENPE